MLAGVAIRCSAGALQDCALADEAHARHEARDEPSLRARRSGNSSAENSM
jgi:hypothetical protein